MDILFYMTTVVVVILGFLFIKEYNKNRKLMIKRFLREYDQAKKINCYYYATANPEKCYIEIPDCSKEVKNLKISIKMLFRLLGIPQRDLKDVFVVDLWKTIKKKKTIFLDEFALDGRQKLAILLNKNIEFKQLAKSKFGKPTELFSANFAP